MAGTPDWQADYEDERDEAAREEAERDQESPRRDGPVVYLVMQVGWEYDDALWAATSDGITLRAFRSRQRAIEYACQLYQEGKLSHWEIVERPLEEGEE